MSEAPAYSVAEFKARWAEVKRESAALEGPSLADRLALCERDEPGTIGTLLDELGPEKTKVLAFDRKFWLRPKQLALFVAMSVWLVALLIAGRGFGKTRPAAEWILWRLEQGARVLVLVGPSYDDIKQFMLGGYKRRIDGGNGSGLLDIIPPWIRYHYKEDEGTIEFPDYGAVLYLHSAEVPEYRGPEPDTVWGDEIIKWRHGERLLSNLRLACRSVGKVQPQILLTTSPKRLRLLRDLVMETGVYVLHGTSRENVGNTHRGVYEANRKRLMAANGKLTRQGEEELGGELGIDDEGELFPMGTIDAHRITEVDGSFDRIAVAVDPAGSVTKKSDKTGIVAAGRKGDINTGHGYVLADATKKYPWDTWGEVVVQLAEDLGASCIVIERNKFADAVAANIRTGGARIGWAAHERPGFKTLVDLVKGHRRIQIIEVLAMGDKSTRAGPVSTIYDAGRAHHVGHFTDLESEMSEYDPNNSDSPNAMDALVHCFTELFSLDRPPTTPSAKPSEMAAANKRLDESAPNRGAQRLPMGHHRGGFGRRTI